MRIDLLRPGFQSPVAAVGYPDFAAYAKACGGDGYRVETLEEFERAFAAALAPGRPTVIDAKVTQWALPTTAPRPGALSPESGKRLEERFCRG
jgi:acetolactate synthase I/II/III large subunit